MDFKQKCNDIAEMLTKLDKNEKKIILKFIIMNDLKLYTEVLFEEQCRLEKECGIKGVVEYESFDNNVKPEAKDRLDGYLGYCDIDEKEEKA